MGTCDTVMHLIPTETAILERILIELSGGILAKRGADDTGQAMAGNTGSFRGGLEGMPLLGRGLTKEGSAMNAVFGEPTLGHGFLFKKKKREGSGRRAAVG